MNGGKIIFIDILPNAFELFFNAFGALKVRRKRFGIFGDPGS